MKIRFVFLLFLLVMTILSCIEREPLDIKDQQHLDSLNKILSELISEKDSLQLKESKLLKELDEFIPNSPAGYSINYKLDLNSNSISRIYFSENGKFRIEGTKLFSVLKNNNSDNYKIYFVDLYGNWIQKEDSIFLNANLAAERKFIEGANNGVKFNEIIDTTFKINWKEIVLNSMYRKDKALPIDFSKSFSRIYEDKIRPSLLLNRDTLDGDYTFLSIRKVKKEDLKNCSSQELRIMRNEIFARLGYEFRDSFLNAYFNEKKWYHKQYKDLDLMLYLTDIEKYNIEFIKKYENE